MFKLIECAATRTFGILVFIITVYTSLPQIFLYYIYVGALTESNVTRACHQDDTRCYS